MLDGFAPTTTQRWQYRSALSAFALADDNAILGALVATNAGDVALEQRNAWSAQFAVLRELGPLAEAYPSSTLYLEYSIPRLGRRVDAVLVLGPALFVIEFKVGEVHFTRAALDQVWDYALDLKHFHEASHHIVLAPILVATDAHAEPARDLHVDDDGLLRPLRASARDLRARVEQVLAFVSAPHVDPDVWESGRYLPTPTIIEAARALYRGHAVEAISRNDAGAQNLATTSRAIEEVIECARSLGRKALILVTGVPGAGKTLVGLDVANRHADGSSASYSVFLSGNGPLVAVLREALTRDEVAQRAAVGERISKKSARQGVEAFIQNVHHFRDDCLVETSAPPEHVVLFDEAQRAWNQEKTSSFMAQKKGHLGFGQSEPEFLLSCLDRHPDWAVVVGLVGGGQEINTGEAGIGAWLEAVRERFPAWELHVSPRLVESEYRCGEELERALSRRQTYPNPALHLGTSLRSFRAETLSLFVRQVLDREEAAARASLRGLRDRYPIVLTRRMGRAKQWLREQARGSERYGIVVSSSAERLKPLAIDVRVPIDPVRWFLDDKDDVRSSYYLEEVATEFVVQGLELDWACVVWDGDLRAAPGSWAHHEFRGRAWNRVKKVERQRYLENAYRVLLTRARQGMVVVVPEGDPLDPTRAPAFYDATFEYLAGLGIAVLE